MAHLREFGIQNLEFGHLERVRSDDTEPRHPMDWMGHLLPERFDLDGRLAGLQEIPVASFTIQFQQDTHTLAKAG
jgi:hypothetical protein